MHSKWNAILYVTHGAKRPLHLLNNFKNMNAKKMRVLLCLLLSGAMQFANAKTPNCTGPDNWPTAMAFVHLKNAGLTDNRLLDFSKTKTTRLASEKIGKDLYRQIHQILFIEKSGGTIEVITSNDASNEECSMSGVSVFVVSKRLGG